MSISSTDDDLTRDALLEVDGASDIVNLCPGSGDWDGLTAMPGAEAMIDIPYNGN